MNRRWNDGPRRDAESPERLVVQMREANESLVLSTARAEESEATFRSLFDAMPQLGWIARADGHIHFFNRGWYQYTGTTFKEMVGSGWRRLVEADQLPAVEARWREYVERGAPFELSFRIRRRDGAYRWFMTRANPEVNGAGDVVRWVGICSDIDEGRRNEERLGGSLAREMVARTEADVGSRRKDDFLAMLAHELRNPLAALSTAQHLIAEVTTEPQVLRFQATSVRQIEHLVRLVDDLLDVARITRGKIELRKQRVDLAAVLQEALNVTRPQMDARGQEVSISRGVGPFCVDGDPTRLEQILNNLLVNASKYTDRGGRIAVSCESQPLGGEDWVLVRVEDNGRGLAPDMVEKVFGLFTQVETSLERAGGGLGIGLTLVRSLVEMHGGTVRARSEGLGKGSTFEVRLPLIAAADAPLPKARRRKSRDSTINHRVVVVEDNEDARELLKEMLERWGHEVEVAADGVAGCALILSSLPDMAFVDVGLPGLDGFAVAEAVRASPDSSRTRLVALTGYGDADVHARALAAGFDHHLVKPVSVEQLVQVLAKRSF